MTKLNYLTIAQAREKLTKKEISAVELTKAHIEAANKHKNLNAYVLDTHELALEQAKKSDEKIAKNQAGIMEGISVGVKDLFCTKNIRTTACSKTLSNFVPPYESTVTQNMFNQGAVMIGKTNMDEFAMGSTNSNSYYGPVINPWKANNNNKDLVPGGSSGGSSAAVAARTCLGALGSDTGGSVRQPAAFTGIVGLKPTYGRCSRYGMVAFASSLDQAGVMTRTVEDAAIMLKSIAGFDAKDSTSSKIIVDDYCKNLNQSIKGKKIGIPKEFLLPDLSPEISAVWDNGKKMLQDAGAEIVEISLPYTKHALPTYYIICPAEASSNLARYDGVRYGLRVTDKGDSLDDMYEKTRSGGFKSEVKRRILVGTYVLSAGYFDAYYKKALKIQKLIQNNFKEVFSKVDAILTPSTPTPAFALEDEPKDPVQMYLNDIFTVTVNIAGSPGISIPGGLSGTGLPLGLQLIGRHFDESGLLNVANILEKQINFNHLPKLVG